MRWVGFALPWLLPCAALGAAPEGDYAQQWALHAQDDAGAYRVELDEAVYRSGHLPSLRDVDVVDATGTPVPASLFPAQLPAPDAALRQVLPWFPLPARAPARGDGAVVLDIERGADGRLRRVATTVADAATDHAADDAAAGAEAWLVDASAVDGRIVALELTWATPIDGLDALYRVEASEDLRDWRVLQPRVPLVDLVRDGERLRQGRIPLDARVSYLRLLPVGGSGAPSLSAVHAEIAIASAPPAWRWRERDGSRAQNADGAHYLYELDGRFPVAQVDVGLAGNSAGEWRLYSREDDAAPWRLRAGPWVSYRIGDGSGEAERSGPQPLAQVVRDRQWKLVGGTPGRAVPVLRLGWLPESLVFVAQGAPPYRLLAGSARAVRAEAPVPRLLEAIGQQRGEGWRPAKASLGEQRVLAGDSALRPLQPGRDWKTWALWAVLAAGALLVAGFAASLLRERVGAARS